MWHRVALLRTDISVERVASIIRVWRISELETTLAINSDRRENFKSYILRTTSSHEVITYRLEVTAVAVALLPSGCKAC
jgi:hypothetical protein